MHLLRVQVPDFRGLKNIDITFEKDFFPKIFPLGSQKGGGKSTLLQLIFVLLHCSVDDEKKPFIQNLLQGFKIFGWEEKKIAIIDIWDGKKIVNLEFYCQSYVEEEIFSPEYDYRGDDENINEENNIIYRGDDENINEENNIIYICSLEKSKDEDDRTTIASTELKCRFNNQSQEQAKSFL